MEVEHRGDDMKLQASANGAYDPVKAGEVDDDGRFPRRNGNWRTGTAHIITAVIGSGVLSLGWAIAQMGWAFGPLTLLMFSAITWYTASLLCEAYRVGDPLTGKRSYNYMSAVSNHLGRGNQIFCAIVQYANLYATGVGYTVTGSQSVTAVKRSICFHHFNEDPEAPCTFNNLPWMMMFGGLQIAFSQIPDFGGLWWLSYLATGMSFAYSFIGLGLSIGKATESGHDDYGTAWGVAGESSPAEATWGVFVALGSMAFAYSFSMILIEIQDTMAQPPSEEKSMKKATHTGIAVTTAFYMSVGCISYAGFGNAAPGNLTTGFGFFKPYWLVGAANVFVFVHLVGAYQVYMQPFMQFVEDCITKPFPALGWQKELNLPGYGYFPLSPLKMISRTVIVVTTTLLAIILPFFNDLIGFIGAIGFWPLTVYFPVEMHIAATKIPRFSRKWIWLQCLSAFTFTISMAAAIGSIEFVVEDLKDYTIFHTYASGSAAADS